MYREREIYIYKHMLIHIMFLSSALSLLFGLPVVLPLKAL